MRDDKVELVSERRTFRPLSHDDCPAVLLTHNDVTLISALLEHYRSLGVTRFLVVDDGSTDGTREVLAQEPDVELYTSNVRYAEAYRGRLWRHMLAEKYGHGRWYVLVDSDEFLVYPGSEAIKLPQLTSELAQRGMRRMAAPMIDMYPAGRIADAHFVYRPGRMPWTIASLFDAGGYRLGGDLRAWDLKGGVRERAFGSNQQLMKYPVMFWDASTRMDKSVHFPQPYGRNFAPPYGALLHFLFFSDFWTRFQATVRNAQHFDGGAVYKKMIERISDPSTLELEGSISAQFSGADDLAARGFMERL